MNSNFKKFIQFAFGNGVALFLGLLTSPLITRLVTTEQFGIFSNFNTVTSLFCMFLICGLDQAYVRFFYEEKEDNRKGLLKECIRIPIIGWGIMAVASIIFYKPISMFIAKEVNFYLVILLIIHTLFFIFYNYTTLVIRMNQRGKMYSLVQILTKLTYVIFVFAMFIIFKDSYWTLVLGLFLSNLAIVIFSVLVERNEWSLLSFKGQVKVSRKSLMKYAGPLLFASAISWIFAFIDRIFLNVYSTNEEVGLYSAAFTIIALLNACQTAFSTFWAPVANEKYINDPDDREFFSGINQYVVVAMCTIAILLIGGKDIVIYLLGPLYREAKYIIPFLSLMPIMYTISEVTNVGISFKQKTKYHVIVAIISAITNIIGNYFLVPQFGGRGAAISTGLSYVVFFMLRTYFSVKLYKVNYHLGRFAIVTIGMIILACYSTFNSINIVIIIMTIANLVLIGVLYNGILKEVISILKKFWKNRFGVKN